jgi:hypothetical protein
LFAHRRSRDGFATGIVATKFSNKLTPASRSKKAAREDRLLV